MRDGARTRNNVVDGDCGLFVSDDTYAEYLDLSMMQNTLGSFGGGKFW